MRTSLNIAFALAAKGLPVFPCRDNKTPACPHGFKDAAADAPRVHALWRCYSGPLIGVPTGVKFDVLDLDLQHEPARQWLAENQHRLPVTRTHRTRSGGKHMLFQPAGLKCSAGRIAPHIDTRGLGGYIIWWPAHGLEVVFSRTLAAVPGWVLDKLKPPTTTQQNTTSSVVCSDAWLRGLARAVMGATEGQRNSALFWAACRAGEALRQGKGSETFVTDVLLAAAARAGLPQVEAKRTISSGFKTTWGRA
jgi:hypothetical protein